jgi:osmotically-inducible protein OsmY
MFENQNPLSRLALKIGVAGVIGFGALATGMFATRKGRRLVGEAWQGRERTRIEDRVLDAWWENPRLARRRLDVSEVEPGRIQLIGIVHEEAEHRLAVRLARRVKGVLDIDDRITVVPREPRLPLRQRMHLPPLERMHLPSRER